MSAEGNLSNPGLFAVPPAVGHEGREYWRGRDGKGGWRVDAVFRRYLGIVYRSALAKEPPARRPLFVPGDDAAWLETTLPVAFPGARDGEPPRKRRREELAPKGTDDAWTKSPNVVGMQAHLFHMLRHFVSKHTDVRDALARARMGDIAVYEAILDMVERRVAEGLLEYEQTGGQSIAEYMTVDGPDVDVGDPESSLGTARACKRPWWVVQPIVRPLPKEALAKGAIQESKRQQKAREKGKKEKEGRGTEAKDGSAADVSTPAAPAQETVAAEDSRPARPSISDDGPGSRPEAAEAEAAVAALDTKTDFPQNNLVSG